MRRNDSTASALVARPLRQGQGWSIGEYLCTAGPDDRRFEVVNRAARLSEAVLGAVSGTTPLPVCASARDARRIGDDLRYIELHAADALDLETLAGVAIMSKYHFLRTFRHIVGMTPYQFVLSVRMRRAAVRLATSSEPVSAIAFETGFGDLSTFNGRFRDVFGMTPMVYRRRERTI